MGEREATREREAGPSLQDLYEELIRMNTARRDRAQTGTVVLRGRDHPWKQAKQGMIKWFLHPADTDTGLDGWMFFMHEIRSQSGRHRHQGGLAIYVVEGKGYTIANGRRVEWEAGDLLLLPIMPDGVEHQHFNTDPEKPSRWLAMIPHMLQDYLGNYITQLEASPDWRET